MSDATDPHRSKIPPDDPRLRIERPRPRTLRKGPAVLAACGVMTSVSVALLVGLSPGKSEDRQAEPKAPTTAASQEVTIPESIRRAPDNRSPVAQAPAGQPATPRLGPRLPGNLGHAIISPDAGAYGAPAAGWELAREHERLEALHKARAAGLFFVADEAPAQEPATSTSATTPAESALPAILAARAAGDRPGGIPEQNLQERKNDFLARSGASAASYLEQPLVGPRSPYELKAGTIIPTVLLTGLSSDLPGQVIGQVRENVYDTVTGNHLLVPQGSRLLAAYDSMVAFGQERVLVCWNRLIRPDGSSIALECMPGVDLAGYAGFADRVDHHWWRVISGVALGSLLAAGAASSQGSVAGFLPTFPQLWAQGAASGMNQAGQQLTQKNLAIQPTITVRPGFSVNVLVPKDIVIPPYRAER